MHILTVNQNKDRDMELWTLAKLHKAVLERDQAGLQATPAMCCTQSPS